MKAFFDWFEEQQDKRPWMIFGKGPSFSQHVKYPNIDKDYVTFGLNHICRERRVLISHAIDANVLDEIPEIRLRTKFILMPMHPHYNFKATEKTLLELVEEHPIIRWFNKNERLLWYNLSTWPKPTPGSPVIRVAYFSAEAAIRLLAMAGVKIIRTLGVDGGTQYSKEFKDIPPFRGGHTTFDLQRKPIEDIVGEFSLDLQPFTG